VLRYDVECSNCGRRGEVVAKNTKRLGRCSSCKGKLIWVPTAQMFAFRPFVHEHLGHTPVQIESWPQYRQILRERNLNNELGS